jgi:hypothetical protein
MTHDPMNPTHPTDPPTEQDICGATAPGPGGIPDYWICTDPPHNPGYKRRTGDPRHPPGSTVYGTSAHPERGTVGTAAPADRHYFQKRWTNR